MPIFVRRRASCRTNVKDYDRKWKIWKDSRLDNPQQKLPPNNEIVSLKSNGINFKTAAINSNYQTKKSPFRFNGLTVRLPRSTPLKSRRPSQKCECSVPTWKRIECYMNCKKVTMRKISKITRKK